MRRLIQNTILLLAVVTVLACSPADGDFQGTEYMPGMGHSIAYEANTYAYYGLNTFSSEEEYKKYATPRKPVEGTIPRGSLGTAYRDKNQAAELQMTYEGRTQANEISIPVNGSVVYPYGDSDDERTRAANEITTNPLPITDRGLESGKELYLIYCGICHGDKGGGDGYLARDDSPYPSVPANLLDAKFRDTTDGLFYHAIMHGKNVMGAYADKLSYQERWNVIHYIRQQQAKDQGLEYSAVVNTLNENLPEAEWASDFEAPIRENNDVFSVSSGHDHHEGDHGHHEEHGHDNHHDHGDHDDHHGHDHDHEDDHGHNGEHHHDNHNEDH